MNTINSNNGCRRRAYVILAFFLKAVTVSFMGCLLPGQWLSEGEPGSRCTSSDRVRGIQPDSAFDSTNVGVLDCAAVSPVGECQGASPWPPIIEARRVQPSLASPTEAIPYPLGKQVAYIVLTISLYSHISICLISLEPHGNPSSSDGRIASHYALALTGPGPSPSSPLDPWTGKVIL